MFSRGEKGSFALFAMLTLTVFALVGGVYYYATRTVQPSRAASRPEDMFDRLREDSEKALGTPDAVNFSLARNVNSFSCLFSGIGDCAGKGSSFLLYESGELNAQPLSQLGKDTGLNADGIGCKDYPSAACMLKVEASWDPVCATAGGRCENTKSMNVKVKISLNDGSGKAPLDWEKSALFSPLIQLSQGSLCERNGGIWANTECLTPEQASQRQLASSGPRGVSAQPQNQAAAQAATPVVPENHDQYICPNQIVVQGLSYPVDFITAGKGQVKVPAMNGCQAEDVFVFQCNRKEPAQFEGEGQWIQTEAVMAGADCQTQVGGDGNTDYQRR
ncbi:MAG: hypothetical protein ACXWQO_13320 [Bdellovibrionota bacterium]